MEINMGNDGNVLANKGAYEEDRGMRYVSW